MCIRFINQQSDNKMKANDGTHLFPPILENVTNTVFLQCYLDTVDTLVIVVIVHWIVWREKDPFIVYD